MRSFILQVPLVDGRPDIDLPPSILVDKQGDVVTLVHEPSGEAATFKFVGVAQGQAVLTGMANVQVVTWLVKQGVTVTRIKDLTQVQKNWLLARGVTASNAGHHFCGLPMGDPDEE